MTKPVHLFMASTPLHILLSTAIASRLGKQITAHLFIIDQKSIAGHPYKSILEQWPQNPFYSIRLFQGGAKGREKLRLRKLIFNEIEGWTSQHKPDVIYVGNDRRIEFQYAMHAASKLKDVRGCYLDEGTYTYVGRKASSGFSDKFVDSTVKKLAYGTWWKHPPTIGGSAWITTCFVAFPHLVHPLLTGKNLEEIDQSYFNNEKMRSFCQAVTRFFQLDEQRLKELFCLITLPHESVMDKIPGYRTNILTLIQSLDQTADGLIGIKYHPRNSSPDIFNLDQFSSCWLVPDGAAYETFLPLLPESTVVIGDMSSTLLSTKWLRPDLTAIAIENRQSPLFADFEPLFNRLNIRISPNDQLGSCL